MTSDTKIGAATAGRLPGRPPSGILGAIMLVLSVASVALLVWPTMFTIAADTRGVVGYADDAICAVFAVEFVWRWWRGGWGWGFPVLYWHELLAMVPAAGPVFQGHRIVRILILIARVGRAADRAVGDRVFAAVTGRLAHTVVAEIKRPVTIAVLDEVADVLRTGNYTRNVAAALLENRSELDEMILELIRRDRVAGSLKWMPFHDDVVRLVAETSFRIVFEVLNDPRTDELVSDLLRENVDQIRSAVRAKYQAQSYSHAEVVAALDRARASATNLRAAVTRHDHPRPS